MKSSNVKSSSSTYGVVPPSNFSYVEENICRCTFPITRHNLSFIHATSLTYIVNLSGKRHDSLVQTFFEEKNIEVKLVLQEGESPPFSPLSALEAWIASTIEVILTKSCECSILLVGGVDTFYDCLVIACLRRLQEWSYVSILAEFRQHTWPHKLHDFEQVIEKFNTALVDLPVNVPEFLSIHDNFKEEEHKLLHKLKNFSPVPQTPTSPFTDSASNQPDSPPLQATPRADRTGSIEAFTPRSKVADTELEQEKEETGDGPEDTIAVAEPAVAVLDEQERIDSILKKLFFSPKNQLISDGTVFDPSISLINEKDEED